MYAAVLLICRGAGTPEMSGSSYILENAYRPSLNGHPDNHSPNSSIQGSDTTTLTRSQKQPNQQVREKNGFNTHFSNCSGK